MTSPTIAINLRLDTNGAPQKLSEVEAGLGGIGRAAKLTDSAAVSVASSLARVAHYTAAGLGLQVIAQYASQSAVAMFSASAAAERLGIQLAFASATPAKDFAYLRDVTTRLGLQFTSTAQAFAGFSAAAKGTSLEGAGARRVFEAIAAASSVMGLSTEQSSGALLAIQQMMSKGVVSAEEFRGQLGERLPIALQAGSRALGVTTAEFSKMLESGQIITADFLPKFAVAISSLLGDSVDNAANRLDAAVNQMENAWERLKKRMGDAGVSQAMATEARALAQEADAVADNMQQVADRGGGAIQQWSAGIGTFLARSALTFVAGSANVFNASVNAMTGNVFALNERINLMPDALRPNAQVLALLTPRLQAASAEYEILQKRLAQAPDNIYLKSELYQLGLYIEKLREAQSAQAQLRAHEAADQELGNGRGSRVRFQKEVDESTKFFKEEQDKASGWTTDMKERITQYQRALERGVISQAQYVQGIGRVAAENSKLMEAKKQVAEVATQAAEFEAQKQKLWGDELVATIKDRVARQVLAEEDGIRQIAKIKADEVAARKSAEESAAKVNAADPAKAQKHAQAAVLAAIEMTNINAQAAREVEAVTQKRADELRGIELQTRAVQKYGVAIDSISTLLLKERVSRTEVALATAEQNRQLAEQRGVGELAAQKEVERLRAELEALRGNADRGHLKDVTQAGSDQTTRLFGNKSEDAFKSLGNTLRETFATSGDGLARMVDAMGALTESGKEYAREMQVINALRATGTESNLATAAKNEQALIAKTAKDQVGAYASMASAAKTYFKEGSTGYKVMQGAEKALRTYQLVMSTQTMAKDLAAIGAKVSAWIFGETAMTTASTAGSTIRTTEAVIEGQTNAVTGVVNQAKGDPYTAFPRMAAMAAIMAALGFAVGAFGGGGGSHTQDALSAMPENTGTGTVFGDSKAQTQSLRNSLEALVSMAKPELAYTSMMAASLRNIEAGIAGGTNLLLRSGFDSSSSSFIAQNSKSMSALASTVSGLVSPIASIFGSGVTNLVNKFTGGLFGSSSTSSSVIGTGLIFDAQSIAQAAARVALQSYQTVQTTTESSSMFGLFKDSSSSESTSTSRAGLDDFANSMSKTIASIRDTAIAAGNQIGAMTQAKINAINNMDLGLGKINLQNKTAKEIEDILSQRLSALADSIAKTIDPVVMDFVKSGEGPYEALVRVASGMEQAKFHSERLGVALSSLSEVQNKAGDVATELLRESLVKAQSTFKTVQIHWQTVGTDLQTGISTVIKSWFVPSQVLDKLSGIGKMIRDFTGSAAEMSDFYAGLIKVQSALVSFGQSADAVTSDLLKGAGGMDALQAGISSFEENFLSDAERAAAQQARLAADFARVGVIMPQTAEQFKLLVKTIDASTAEGQKTLGGLLSLSSGFKDLLDTQAAASKAAQDEADAAAKAQKDWIDKLNASGKSISQWLANLDTGGLGASSTLDQKLGSARGQYVANLSLARRNDQEALSAITGQAQAYLQAARDASSSESQYKAVLAQVKSELRSLPAVKSYEGQMLDALTQINATIQLDLINTLNSRFTMLDANVDGLLTYSELRAGLSITDAQIESLIAVVDANGDGQISALEAQTAWTRLVKSSTDGVGQSAAQLTTSATQQLQAMIKMNNDGLVAISWNTGKSLDVMCLQGQWLSEIAASTAKIAANPTSVNVSSGGGGGIISKVASFLGFAQGDVFGGSGIFTQPTSFNFGGTQLGALGEAGPEAVMPLERMGDGSLGVRAMYSAMPAPLMRMDFSALADAFTAGMQHLSDRIDQLDANNNAGNAAIANATQRTAKVLDAVSLGDALQVEAAA